MLRRLAVRTTRLANMGSIPIQELSLDTVFDRLVVRTADSVDIWFDSNPKHPYDLVRRAENYDATIAAAALAGTPIAAGAEAVAERQRKGLRIEQLRGKWDI